MSRAAPVAGQSGGLGWGGIFRLGLVQTALGAIVVLCTSTLNRVMVVEFALPASLPGALVGLHYAIQMVRPRLGHGSDAGGRHTPFILGGMAVLAVGSVAAAIATAWMATAPMAGIALAVLAYTVIGVGVGAAGTALLVMMSKQVVARRRAAAATIMWTMMIAGFAVTSGVAGKFLDPFTPLRLVEVMAVVAVTAFVLAAVAVWGVERAGPAVDAPARSALPFREALGQVWAEPLARRFTLFVFVSMLAYSGQELILEPFAGLVFGMTPGQSAGLSAVLHAGAVVGMLLVAVAAHGLAGRRFGSLRAWTVGGCVASAVLLVAVALSGVVGAAWPLRETVWLLGVANGAFAVAAIGSMMELAGHGTPGREGVRMGLWGAAQAVAFALGGLVGTAGADLARHLLDSPVLAYLAVFAGEGALFLFAARLAGSLEAPAAPASSAAGHVVGETRLAGAPSR